VIHQLTCFAAAVADFSSASGAGAHAEQYAKELDSLKEMNKAMQQELNELHERYSEISLKFAEVEGERQQLVMTVRTLKNALR
jgi:prefoldin subunit 5